MGRKNTEFLDDFKAPVEAMNVASDEDKVQKKRLLGSFIHSGGMAQYRAMIQKEEKEELKRQLEKVQQMRSGLHSAEGFKKALRARCGSLYGAWRGYLDLD